MMNILKAGITQAMFMEGGFYLPGAIIQSIIIGFALTLAIYGLSLSIIETSIELGHLNNTPFAVKYQQWRQYKYFKQVVFITIYIPTTILFFIIWFFPDLF